MSGLSRILSFIASLILGPLLAAGFGIAGIFWITAVLALIAGAAAFALFGSKPDTAKEQAALEMQYAGRRYDEAAATAQAILAKDPAVRAAYLALGNIFLKRGELDEARSAFEKAIGAETGTEIK